MKNKKGFTLIELLAVIVVLAIIALIATPIVMNTIKNSQKGAAERSAENYIDAVETAVATAKLDSDGISDGTYTIDENGNLLVPSLSGGKLTIEMNGNKPTGGTITIKNGQVTTDSKMTVGSYEVSYDPTTKKYEATEKGTSTKTYVNGEVVYFDVTAGKLCSEEQYNNSYGDATTLDEETGEEIIIQDYQNSMSGYNGINHEDKQNSCLRFYAFNDDGGDTVNLILDHDTDAKVVVWNSSGSNINGPSEVLAQLKTDTDAWQGTETPTNYTMDQTGQTSNAKYTIDYSGYKARLITAQEVAQITGNTTWNEKVAANNSDYYFDSKTDIKSVTCTIGNTTGCQYGWLYDRTNLDCTRYGCLNNSGRLTNGYWTASSQANDADRAWVVGAYGYMNYLNGSVKVDHRGVRPVIEVLRSKLS